MMTTCPRCQGLGQLCEAGEGDLVPCRRCNGNGAVPVVETRCPVCDEAWRLFPSDVRGSCARCGTHLIRVEPQPGHESSEVGRGDRHFCNKCRQEITPLRALRFRDLSRKARCRTEEATGEDVDPEDYVSFADCLMCRECVLSGRGNAYCECMLRE